MHSKQIEPAFGHLIDELEAAAIRYGAASFRQERAAIERLKAARDAVNAAAATRPVRSLNDKQIDAIALSLWPDPAPGWNEEIGRPFARAILAAASGLNHQDGDLL